MSKYILGFLAIVIGWLVLIGSFMACYLIVQASHPNVSPSERAYKDCLNATNYKQSDVCAKILKVKL